MPKPFNFIKPETNIAYYDNKPHNTGSLTVPSGTTAERPGTPTVGMLRYNQTTGYAEVYTAAGWGIFGALPPSISSVSPVTFNGEQGTTFTINGTNFTSDVTVKFITNGAVEYTAGAVTFINSGQITATTPRDFTVAEEPLDVKVIQTSGTTTAVDVIDCGGTPSWTTTAGSLGNVYDVERSVKTFTVVATDPDTSATISYSLSSGSLPTGMSLNSSTGVISGTASAVVSDTTFNFDITATDNAGNTSSRSFSITSKAPVITSFTATGASTFNVPSGVSRVRVLVIAGGGGGGDNNSGGGGAGGMIDHPGYTVTPGAAIPLNVGTGGTGLTTPGGSSGTAPSGGDSNFGGPTGLTAKGGGGSDGWTSFKTAPSGGSGAGGAGNPGYRAQGGTGTQPSQPGDSGTYGYGYPGGLGGNASVDTGGGGGGGAGGAGVDNMGYPGSPVYPGNGSAGGHGGLAKISDITGSPVYYAGGGGAGAGGSGSGPYWPGSQVIGGRGGIGGPYTNPYASSPLGGAGNGGAADRGAAGTAASANTGSGGGGGDNTNGGNGGSGIVIVRY